MKKILSILGAITLIGTSSTSLVACNKNEYTAEELKELKEKNKINTKDKTIRDNLEWIAHQEKPFYGLDYKVYFIKYYNNYGAIELGKRTNNNPYTNNAIHWSNMWISVYRWNLDPSSAPDLILDKDGNIKVNGE